MLKLIFALIAVAVAVPAGGLLAGVDRRLTARLQSRQGPPLLQPFYDVLKLFGKAPCVTNPWLIFSSYVCLMASAIALLMFFMAGRHAAAVLRHDGRRGVQGGRARFPPTRPTATWARSANCSRCLAYEPLVILTFVGMSAATGSFMISDNLRARRAMLLPHLPFCSSRSATR